MTWCFLHILMRFWPAFHNLMDYGSSNELYKLNHHFSINVISHHLYCVPRPLLNLP